MSVDCEIVCETVCEVVCESEQIFSSCFPQEKSSCPEALAEPMTYSQWL